MFVGCLGESPNACVLKTSFHTFFLLLCACFMAAPMAIGQSSEGRCVILGKVVDATTNAPLPFASVVLQGQTSGTATDFEGAYRLEGVPAGVHNVVVSFLGYTSETVYEIETTQRVPLWSTSPSLRRRSLWMPQKLWRSPGRPWKRAPQRSQHRDQRNQAKSRRGARHQSSLAVAARCGGHSELSE